MGAGSDARPGGVLAPGRGPGWAKLAEAVAVRVPPGEIEALYVFRPFKRDGREWGTAVVTRRAPDGRVQVYTAKYMLIVRGKERGRGRCAVEEVGLSPTEVLEQVMRATAERTGESVPPDVVNPAVWYEG